MQRNHAKWLYLGIHEMTTEFKNVVDSIVVTLKAKEINDHVTQGEKTTNPSQLVLAGSHISKDDRMGKTLNLQRRMLQKSLKATCKVVYGKRVMQKNRFSILMRHQQTNLDKARGILVEEKFVAEVHRSLIFFLRAIVQSS